MKLKYHEAMAVVPLQPEQTLNTFHNEAWKLFDGGRKVDLDKRPFHFRFEPLDDSRALFMIRNKRSFPGSNPRTVHPDRHKHLECRYAFSPIKRNRKLHGNGYKERVAPRNEWRDKGIKCLERAGLEIMDVINVKPIGFWKKNERNNASRPVVDIRCHVKIDDPDALAKALLHGIGRERGYGMGLIQFNDIASQQSGNAA